MKPESPDSKVPADQPTAGERGSRGSTPLHSLLRRQLRRHFGAVDAVPEDLRAFVSAINDAYQQSDRDRIMLERSIALSSDELLHANVQMRHAMTQLQQAQLELESRVADRTRELTAANDTLRQSAADQRHLEARLRQAQKMEAIGLLAGGVAHDFNNLLTVIFGQLDLLRYAKNEKDWKEAVREIHQAAESAASLTHQLLAFSRQQALTPTLVDVNDLVRDTTVLLRRLMNEGIELVLDLDPDAGAVRADAGQLQQVLLNLGVNARDAMPDGGRLSIATSAAVIDAETAPDDVPIQPGRYAVIAVADTGIGMDADTKARIFEPFFTTKALHQGTGLGLATAYGIVKQSDGYISVTSEPGCGSTFRVLLPQVGLDRAAHESAASAPSTGVGTILVAEDQDAVRRVICARLRHAGYAVHEARSGPAALDIASGLSHIDLLLTDVVMPHMSGRTLALRLLDERPDLKVIYMTGHISDVAVTREIRSGSWPLLQKPFPTETLLAAIRDLLG
jgi:two-component system cell cycle sensor histidine kinase/response regulator CckA